MHLLQDRSQEYEDTWRFVKRAVDECVKLDTMLESNAGFAKDIVTASVSTVSTALKMFSITILYLTYYYFLNVFKAKNILGISWNR